MQSGLRDSRTTCWPGSPGGRPDPPPRPGGSARPPRRARVGRGIAVHDRRARLQESLRERRQGVGWNTRERNVVKLFRTLPTRKLIALAVGVLVVAIGGASIAVAAGGGGPTPPPKPL